MNVCKPTRQTARAACDRRGATTRALSWRFVSPRGRVASQSERAGSERLACARARERRSRISGHTRHSALVLLLLQLRLLPAARLRPSVSRRARPLAASASAATLDALSEQLPFLDAEELLADDVSYRGLGLSLSGRADVCAALGRMRATLPSRLPNFECTDKTLLPPDARNVVTCRYKLSFDAPVPPAVLPAQMRRLDAAQLVRTADGRTRVTAIVAASLQLDDATGRVRRLSETLVADPFEVTASIVRRAPLATRPHPIRPPPPRPPTEWHTTHATHLPAHRPRLLPHTPHVHARVSLLTLGAL